MSPEVTSPRVNNPSGLDTRVLMPLCCCGAMSSGSGADVIASYGLEVARCGPASPQAILAIVLVGVIGDIRDEYMLTSDFFITCLSEISCGAPLLWPLWRLVDCLRSPEP